MCCDCSCRRALSGLWPLVDCDSLAADTRPASTALTDCSIALFGLSSGSPSSHTAALQRRRIFQCAVAGGARAPWTPPIGPQGCVSPHPSDEAHQSLTAVAAVENRVSAQILTSIADHSNTGTQQNTVCSGLCIPSQYDKPQRKRLSFHPATYASFKLSIMSPKVYQPVFAYQSTFQLRNLGKKTCLRPLSSSVAPSTASQNPHPGCVSALLQVQLTIIVPE